MLGSNKNKGWLKCGMERSGYPLFLSDPTGDSAETARDSAAGFSAKPYGTIRRNVGYVIPSCSR